MRYLPNGTQMSSADKFTIEETGIPSLVLMERAALKTVEIMHVGLTHRGHWWYAAAAIMEVTASPLPDF